MRALIYGSGAVGIGIGAALMDTDWKIDIKASGATKSAISQNGIKRIGLFKEISISHEKFNVFENLEDIQNDSYDYILVCTKAMFNEIIAKDIYSNRSILSESGKIVIFQNGWGNDEPYLKYFDIGKVFNARVITGFTRPKRHISEVTVHASPILIGSLHNHPSYAVAALAEAINKGGIPCAITNEIEKALWAKMLYNCTLNPLGAILGVNYGRLTESESSVHIMNMIIDEIFSVIKAGGYQTYWNDSNEYKEVFYKQLIPPTYNHRSSTLQDIERKSKTEIDTLTGSIVRLGAKFSVEVPYNRMIFNLIKTIESFF